MLEQFEFRTIKPEEAEQAETLTCLENKVE